MRSRRDVRRHLLAPWPPGTNGAGGTPSPNGSPGRASTAASSPAASCQGRRMGRFAGGHGHSRAARVVRRRAEVPGLPRDCRSVRPPRRGVWAGGHARSESLSQGEAPVAGRGARSGRFILLSVWAAERVTRSRLVPTGTVGGLNGGYPQACASSAAEALTARFLVPRTTGRRARRRIRNRGAAGTVGASTRAQPGRPGAPRERPFGERAPTAVRRALPRHLRLRRW